MFRCLYIFAISGVCLFFISQWMCSHLYALYYQSDTWYKFRKSLVLKLLFILPYSTTLITLLSNSFTHGVFYIDSSCNYIREGHIVILYGSVAAHMIFGVFFLYVHRKLFTKELYVALMAIFPMELSAVIIQYFYPELFIEIFILVVANVFILLNIQRPEDNMDRNMDIRNYYAYTTD